MQNKLPIGIFDSGIGGLSVLKEIQNLLPHEDLLYIADSAYAPYGNKDLAFIQQRCEALTRFLIEQPVKAVVIACNTATAAAVTTLRQRFALPIIAMEPGVKPAIAATRSGVVGVMATENTLASQQFTDLLHRHAAHVEVISQPCPGLVEQIEAGEFATDQTCRLIRQYTEPLLAAGADTIVLGCTHYPLIQEQIREVLGEEIALIETGQAVARQLQRKLQEQQLLSSATLTDLPRFWTSADTILIGRVIGSILGQSEISVTALPDTH